MVNDNSEAGGKRKQGEGGSSYIQMKMILTQTVAWGDSDAFNA